MQKVLRHISLRHTHRIVNSWYLQMWDKFHENTFDVPYFFNPEAIEFFVPIGRVMFPTSNIKYAIFNRGYYLLDYFTYTGPIQTYVCPGGEIPPTVDLLTRGKLGVHRPKIS